MTLGRVAALALFSGSVSATGNAIAQSLDLWSADADGSTESSERVRGTGYDPAQTLRFFVYGVAFAPVSFRWHAFLNSRFPLGAASIVKAVPGTATGASAFVARFQTSKAAAVLKRIAVDQAVFAPLASGTFVVGMGILEGLGPEELLERMRTYYLRILLAGYLVWPAAQLINFSVVPLVYRVPFGSVVGLFWNTYLSWTSARMRQAQHNKGSTPTRELIGIDEQQKSTT